MVEYEQTPEKSSAGLVGARREYLNDAKNNQARIFELKSALNDLPSTETELNNKFIAGKAMFIALQKEGEAAINKRIDTFNAYENFKNTD